MQYWISTYGDGEAIYLPGFQSLLKAHQLLLKKFEDAFNSKIWSAESLDSTLSLLPRKSFSNSQISGELFVKVGDKHVHQHAILRDKVLLLYDHINSKYPSQMIHMEGCYAEIIGDYYVSNKYGIQITHQHTSYGEIMLWSDSRKERDDWLRYLEQVSNHRKFKEFYSLNEKVGQGKFSDVYICTEHKSYKKWAVKVINKQKLSALEKELLSSEIKILRLLNHPNIVKINEIFDSKKHILIVMELIEGGELFELIQRKKVFSEYTTSKIVKQLLEALVYLHDLGILHRDIKPENILLTDDSDIPQIKLADFGLSKLSGPNDVQILACGTLGYVAAEVLSQEGYTFKADLWSVGIITYLLLRGRLPFDHKDKKVLIDLTLKASLSFEDSYWKAFTPFALDFISKLINKNQLERMSPKEALNHPWRKNADILIPRAIDRKKMEDLFIEKGVTSSNFGNFQYKEVEVNIEDHLGVSYEVRSMPDLFGEFESPVKVDESLVLVHSVVD